MQWGSLEGRPPQSPYPTKSPVDMAAPILSHTLCMIGLAFLYLVELCACIIPTWLFYALISAVDCAMHNSTWLIYATHNGITTKTVKL